MFKSFSNSGYLYPFNCLRSFNPMKRPLITVNNIRQRGLPEKYMVNDYFLADMIINDVLKIKSFDGVSI